MSDIIFATSWGEGWKPDPDMTVDDWADANIVLSTKSSAEPGQYRSSRTPYVKEIMQALSPTSRTQRVVWVAGAQLGKTQSGLNWVGSVIDQWPGPMLMVMPTIDLAEKVSKQRMAPLIEDTPALRKKVTERRTRDSGNTILGKEFPGGMLMMTGANSASGLRSMPIRYLYADEIDAYPQDIEGEGAPLDLAEKRTNTFARKKIFITSTPTIKGVSAIEKEWEQSDKRYYFVPCPHCGDHFVIKWDNITWDEGKPETAACVCKACGCVIEEHHKTQMLAKGEWRATAVGNGTAGYHLSGLYSPLGWKSWAECVREFIAAKDNPEKLKVWVNTVLAEWWEEKGEAVDPDSLKARLETYKADVPNAARILVCSTDVQGDRLEAKVKAFGRGEESWLVAYTQIHGDPGTDAPWFELDEFLQQAFQREDGQTMYIDTTVVDSGGHHTDSVYKFCKARAHRRVFAIKGQQLAGKEIVGRPSQNNRYRVKLFMVGVDAAKDRVQSRLKIQNPGPGYMHLPDWIDDEYLAQLTSEKAIRKYIKGPAFINKLNDRAEDDTSDQATLQFNPDQAPEAGAQQGQQTPEAPKTQPKHTLKARVSGRPGGWMGGIGR